MSERDDLDASEDEFEVVIVDDETDDPDPALEPDDESPEDSPEPSPDADDDRPDDEDLESIGIDPDEYHKYGKRAQTRIRKLVAQNKALQKQLAEREHERQTLTQRQGDYQKRQAELEEGRITEWENRLKVENDAVKAAWKKAKAEGDEEAEWDATEKLTEIKQQLIAIGAYKAQVARAKQAEPKEKEAQPQTPPAAPQPDPKLARWMKNNQDWFGKNKRMTGAAYGIHQELLDEGYDPNDGDPEMGADAYYKELSKRIREEFPTYFKDEKRMAGKKTPVAGAPAAASKGKTQLRLTKSQAATADRLNIPRDAYAKQLRLIQERDKGKA